MIEDTFFGEGAVYGINETNGASGDCMCTSTGCSCTTCDRDSVNDSIGQIMLAPTQSVS